MNWLERWRGISWDPPGDLGWLFVLLALGAVAYAVVVYRRTDAPLSPGLRAALAGLRAVALLLLVAILCRPVLSLALPGGAERGVLVLLDRSQSLQLPGADPTETRQDELERAVRAVEAELGGSYPLSYRGFDRALGESWNPDQPLSVPDGPATDLAVALEDGLAGGADDRRPGALVLISDGAQTAGVDPVPLARRLGVPVETVALGTPTPVADLALTRVRVNREAYVGEKSPVEAIVRLQGLDADTVTVRLVDVTDGEVEVASGGLLVAPDGAEYRIPLTFTPTETGLRFLEVRIPAKEGEATSENNRRMLAVRVREEKTGVLLLSGAMTWDHSFLRRSLEADSTLKVASAWRRNGRFVALPGSPAMPEISAGGLEDQRVIVLDHTTTTELGPRATEAIAGFVGGGGGLLVITGSRPGGVGTFLGTPLEALLPVQVGNTGAGADVSLRLTAEGRRHAVFDPSSPGAPGLDAWVGLPPLPLNPDLGPARGNAEVLLASEGAGNHPALTWARAGQGRVMVFAGGGIWKWDFTGGGGGPGGNVIPGWWRRTVRWLARPEVETRFDVHPQEDVVSRGEAVTFVARVTDERYQPIPEVEVEVDIDPWGEGDTRTLTLGGGDGVYSGNLGGLEPGRYRYTARARTPQESIGATEGVFAVDSLGTEMERLEADHELLERIAAASGGHLWSVDSLDALAATFAIKARAEEERVQLALWDHPLLFVLFVLAASAEWLLRRRRGLI